MKNSQNTPYLLATAGFPCSGKTMIAKHLEKELGFERISTDDIRKMLWGVDSVSYEEFKKDPFFEHKETSVFNRLNILKLEKIFKQYDVVIDATSFYNLVRDSFFNTDVITGDDRILELPAQKYLIRLDVSPAEIIRRNTGKGRSNNVYDDWKGRWEEPTGIGYDIMTFENSKESDLEKIFYELNEKFRR